MNKELIEALNVLERKIISAKIFFWRQLKILY